MRWSDVQGLYDPDVRTHWDRCVQAGLSVPLDVFEQLFHDHHEDPDFARDLVAVDWTQVVWEEQELSGVKWRRVATPRGYQYAVDEARARTLQFGLQDERADVQASWRDVKTWVRAPVLLEGRVLGQSLEYQVRVGFTRLGDLLGLLDRGEVPEVKMHWAHVGTLIAP
jgi:hypothetical protein